MGLWRAPLPSTAPVTRLVVDYDDRRDNDDDYNDYFNQIAKLAF